MTTARKPGGRPTAARAAAIRAAVVTAAIAAFADRGSAFSMDEVAHHAGVSKQAIYRRWRSKIDLVVEAIESMLPDGLDGPPEPQADPVAALEAMAWRHLGRDPAASCRLNVHLQVESFRDPRLRAQLRAWHGRYIAAYDRALRDIDAAGRRAPGDIAVQAELLMTLIGGGTHELALAGLTGAEDRRRCFDRRWDAFRRIAIR